ncbi:MULTISPECIES: hypothetical protein [Haloarcula]|uniref:Uncharacterized protein n=1 Tax=Haloarcula pellucida TaxID=1427151 RepID=A0A830GKG1_9EURY|nr:MULTISPECIES: hypothetical protein [Halomicroarcula]MBX0348412.1 hypothetical protein [Halomicroarcula pellucida]MDS0278236.1 hypothetical protein [Halomicroarcula sp. S1AR25-4]QIO23884.1 hypothetical protein G9465_16635 [Haloarcula sp. JP-L23]GGN93482.1 hypothetical protein GCM10009030_18960 [Halomicroarcula pellucida]
MSHKLSERLKSLVGGPGRDAGRSTDSPEDASSLRTCPECEKTFIVSEMERCPDCGTAVEETPTERDLGLL